MASNQNKATGSGSTSSQAGQQSSESAAQNTHLNLSIINFVVRFNIYSCQSAVHHGANTDRPMHAAVGNFEFSFHLHMYVFGVLEETGAPGGNSKAKSKHGGG